MRKSLSVVIALTTGLGILETASAESKQEPATPTGSIIQGPRNQAAIDSALPAPNKPLVVVPPVCPGPGCPDFDNPQPTAQYKRVLFLNFDGATIKFGSDNATQDSSRILRFDSRVIPPMVKEHLDENSAGNLTLQQIKDITVDNVRYHMTPYNVEVVTERPSSGSYHMIVFSGVDDCETIAGANCAGIAPLDCYDNNPSNIVWVFAGGLRISDLATTASHEAAHALGVFHTLDTLDIMYPSIRSQIPENFGAGEVPDGSNCQGQTFQDSDGLLVETIGNSLPDNTPPNVEISQPAPGLVIGPGSMIEARVNDNQNAIAKVDIYLNGELRRSLDRETRPWVEFLGPQTPTGPLTIRVVAEDTAGNVAETSVDVEFDKGGNTPCTTDEQCIGDFECNGAVCVPRDPNAGALGTECAADDECDTGLCAQANGESRCTQLCDGSNPCPGGFECLDNTACWPADGGGGGGCSVSKDGKGSMLGLLLMACVLALGARRRR
ncbi:MAG: hypothetical protein KJO07_04110 [Deltaproteobacteria bacterium]|nr:hypothetical protein [Deltaproteobacteria bacterium]